MVCKCKKKDMVTASLEEETDLDLADWRKGVPGFYSKI